MLFDFIAHTRSECVRDALIQEAFILERLAAGEDPGVTEEEASWVFGDADWAVEDALPAWMHAA